MIIRLHMKTPDVLCQVGDQIRLENINELSEIRELCRRWIEYDENITLEIDTEKETCVVVPVMFQ